MISGTEYHNGRVLIPPAPDPLLLPDHGHELFVGSGIDPHVAARRGYRSVTAAEVRALGFAPSQCRNGWVAPLHTLAGAQVNNLLKPDQPRVDEKGKTLKYEAPAGSVPHLDIHPDARHVLRDPSTPLGFTEGTKKADSAWSRGIPFVSLTGVYHFLHNKLVVADLDEIALNGRLVWVAFDSDVTRKKEVQEALFRFCAALHRRGAEVKVIHLPQGSDGSSKVGLDDWFVAGGTVDGLDTLMRPWDGEGPGVWLRRAGDADPAELERTVSGLVQAMLNPELNRTDLTLMASTLGTVRHKQARGEVAPDGSVVVSAAEISNDWRRAPAKGERLAPTNRDGSKPRFSRARTTEYIEKAVERGLLSAVARPVIRQHDNGTSYKATDWAFAPGVSLVEMVKPWASYSPTEPKVRKPRSMGEPCPECGEVHAIQRVDFCQGCGAKVADKTIKIPEPASDSTSDILSEVETTDGSVTLPTPLSNVRQFIRGTDHNEPDWLAAAPEPPPDDEDHGRESPLWDEWPPQTGASAWS